MQTVTGAGAEPHARGAYKSRQTVQGMTKALQSSWFLMALHLYLGNSLPRGEIR